MKKRLTTAILLLVGVFLALLNSQSADARSGGIVEYSGNPATNNGNYCNVCHSGGSIPVVTLVGPNQVAAGQVLTLTLEIQSASPAVQTHAGLNVSATAGQLASLDADTQVMADEITHTGAKMNDGTGLAAFDFQWTAPSHPTQTIAVTLYAAGNSVNMRNGTGGDAAATDILRVSVAPSAPCSDYDFDCNYAIDAGDIAAVASNWNCTDGCGDYDLNNDGDVDVQDVMSEAGHWGCAWPDACYY